MARVALGGSNRTQATSISAADAAALVGTGDWVEYGTGIGQPDLFDTALAARVDELEDVKIRACLTVRPRAVLEADPGREHFHWFNWHYTGYDRAKGDAGLANYIPCNLGEVPDYYRRFIDPPDVAVLKTCPKDEHGFYNFSLADVLAPRDRRAREDRDRRGVSSGCRISMVSRTRCTRARSTT